MRDRSMQNRISVILGMVLVFAMAASLLLPLFSNFIPPAQVDPATATPRPTVPAPVSDLNSISFAETYVHPSGLFTAAKPSGYTISNEFSTTGEAQATMRNADQLSVLEIRVTRPTAEQDITTADGVGSIFNDEWLTSSWREYSTWDETERRVEGDNVIIDFNLSRSGQDYIARQQSFTDGTWVYSVRVVTPSNAAEMLRYVLENEVNSFQPVAQYTGLPMEWNAYYDTANQYVIRYPGTWVLEDSAPGAPASIRGNNVVLRVEALDTLLDSEETASEYVAGLRSGIEVLSVEPVEQLGATGFNVAYKLTTLDGASESGLVTILNDEVSQVANVLLTDVADTDLNAVDTAAADAPQNIVEAVNTLATFYINPEIGSASTETE
jgi:hypothetical protein